MSPRITQKEARANAEVIGRAKGTLKISRIEQRERVRIEQRERNPYGADSPHSWVADRVACSGSRTAVEARDRLDRFANFADAEKRSVSSSVFPWLGAQAPLEVEEQVAYGVRATAPLAAAMYRMDLPEVGTQISWAQLGSPGTVGVQTAENVAVPSFGDETGSGVQDPIRTIAAETLFSLQTRERSGGWWDQIIGYELGKAFGTQLEKQIWNGTGASGQLTGLTVAAGSSSSTVAGQTLANQTAKIGEQFSQIATNLGQVPDTIAMAARRYAGLQSLANALGLSFDDLLHDDLNLVVSPGAPLTLGAGTEDWMVLFRAAEVPLVAAAQPTLEFHAQGPSAGTNLSARWLIYAYVALGVTRRPAAIGCVKGATAPAF